MNNAEKKENVFSQLGLTAETSAVEVGKTYPIFGVITELEQKECGRVVAVVNSGIVIKMNIPNEKTVRVLRERAYESGIFISKVTSVGDKIEADCKTVIFGKSQAFNA